MAQIGTIRLQTQNSGTVSVPVFDVGDSGSSVYEFVRVETATGTGFIPVTSTNDAAYPYLRVQSQNNGIVAVTDTASAIPDSVIYDFESGDTSNWDTAPDISADTTRAYNGTYAGYATNSSNSAFATVVPEGYGGGAEPSKFEYWWNETVDSKGAGIRLFNSNGNYELGIAANNPEWSVYDDNGYTRDVGDGSYSRYDTWIRFTVTFDWTNNTFDLDFYDSGTGYNLTDSGRPLRYGTDVETIRLGNQDDGGWENGDPVDQWYDDIQIFS